MPDTRPSRDSGRAGGGSREDGGNRAGGVAALLYGGAALVAGVAFWAVTTFAGTYPAVARFGGAAWLFLLVTIVLMPIVIPRVGRRSRAREGRETGGDFPPAACESPALPAGDPESEA